MALLIEFLNIFSLHCILVIQVEIYYEMLLYIKYNILHVNIVFMHYTFSITFILNIFLE